MTHKATSWNTLQDLVSSFPGNNERPALMRFRKSGHDTFTYGRLFQDVRELAWGMIQTGIKPGEVVGLLGPLDATWLTVCLGAVYAGAVVMPLDVQLDRETLDGILADSGPRSIFTHENQWSQFREIAPKRCAVYFMDKPADETKSWKRLTTKDPHPLPDVKDDQPAALFYTSGTTGPPKGVPLTHRNLVFQIHRIQETRFLRPDDRVLLPLPPHHVYPFVIGILAPLSLGAAVVLPHSLTGPQMMRTLREGDISLLLGVPRLYQALFDRVAQRFESRSIARRLFDAVLKTDARLRRKSRLTPIKWLLTPFRRRVAPRLRILASGGAPLSRDLAERLESLGWQVAIGYGLTETAPLLTLKLPGDPHLDTAGYPIRGVDLRIDPDAIENSDRSDREAEGEILARGPNVFEGYHHLPDQTREAFTPDGWFRTGDLGYLDAEGYLHLTGRVSTLIITREGEKVQPDAIEERLSGHPLIREAGVFQQESGSLSGVIVPEMREATSRGIENLDQSIQDAIHQSLQDLPSYQHIHDPALTRTPLPRTRLGKIRRHLLEEIFTEAKNRSLASEKAEPISLDDMSGEDRSLLTAPEVKKVWDWLSSRYRHHRLTPDTRFELDLAVDSMEWLTITLEIGQRTGFDLSEEEIGEVTTVRDLLRILARKASEEEPGTRTSSTASAVTPEQTRWLQPPGPSKDRLARVLFALNRTIAVRLFDGAFRGVHHVPMQGPFVITPNHVSYVDAFAIAAALDVERLHRIYWAGFTGAAFRNVFVKYFSRVSRTLPIDPAQGILTGMALAATVLKRDQGLVWFPEGERSPNGRLQPFKTGVGILLSHYPVPVIPAFIRGTKKILPPGKAVPRPGRIQVAFGPALRPDALSAKGEGARKIDRIASALHQEVKVLGDRM